MHKVASGIPKPGGLGGQKSPSGIQRCGRGSGGRAEALSLCACLM